MAADSTAAFLAGESRQRKHSNCVTQIQAKKLNLTHFSQSSFAGSQPLQNTL